jgi:hypothetical protein
MHTVLVALVLSFAAPAFADGTLILSPSLPNGQKFLVSPEGYTSSSPYEYCQLIKYCLYNVEGCMVRDAADRISSDSSPDGACKALGFSKALASTVGSVKNSFGQTRSYDPEGHLVGLSENEKMLLRNRRRGKDTCTALDPAGRTFLYEDRAESVFSSITCE